MTTPSLPLEAAKADSNLRDRCAAYADMVVAHLTPAISDANALDLARRLLIAAAAHRRRIPYNPTPADYDDLVLAAICHDGLLCLPLSARSTLSAALSTADDAAELLAAAIAFHHRSRLTTTP